MNRFLLFIVLVSSSPAFAHEGAPVQLSRLSGAVDVEALFDRAADYRNLGRVEDAEVTFALIEAVAPNERRVWMERGRLALHGQDPAAAIRAFTEFLEAGPSTYAVHLLRGRAFVRTGRSSEATEDFEAAISLHPGVDAYVELTRVLIAERRFGRASEVAHDGVMRTNADVLREQFVRSSLLAGDLDGALAALDPILRRARVRTRWLLLRAEVHDQRGDLVAASADRNAALDAADRLITKRPSPAALAARGAALASLGRHGEAIDTLREALTRAPRMVDARALYDELRGTR